VNEELVAQLNFIRRGGLVKRYHTVNTINPNTVAHHSFGVAWLVHLLTDGCSYDLIIAALAHDLAEQVTGDISSPTKRRFPVMAEMVQQMEDEILESHGMFVQLTAADQRILKMADCLDGMLFCINEIELGNAAVIEVYNRYQNYVQELKPLGREWFVFQAVRAIMNRRIDVVSQ